MSSYLVCFFLRAVVCGVVVVDVAVDVDATKVNGLVVSKNNIRQGLTMAEEGGGSLSSSR